MEVNVQHTPDPQRGCRAGGPGRAWRLLLAGVFAAGVAVTLTVASYAAPGAELLAISSRWDKSVSAVVIEASAPVAYVTSQPDPLTVLVDLRNVESGVLAQPVGPAPPIVDVSIGDAVAADGTPVARVRVRLDRPAAHRVRSARNFIYVEVDRAGSIAAVAAPPAVSKVVPPSVAPKPGPTLTNALAAATAIRAIRPMPLPNGMGIAIVGDGELTASKVEALGGASSRVFLDFPNVSARGVPAVTDVGGGEVERVRVAVNSTSPLVTRVVIDLARQIAYRLERVGQELRVLFEGTPIARTEPIAPAAPSAPSAPGAAATSQQPPAPPPPPVLVVDPPPPPVSQPDPRYKGHAVSFDFQGADLRSVLRTFAEISGLNIVIDPTINGVVDVQLRDVPWDQALDIILRANKLGFSIDGNIIRIVPVAVLAQEEEERRKLDEAKALAGNLEVMTVPLSYAKAGELVSILTRSALSLRGEVQVDARTNTLIIKDLPDRLTTVSELVKALDRPQRQVEIEARIVQTNRDFARAIGVQWGFNGRVDPTLGNTTPLAFPNSGSVGGRSVQSDTANDTGVNLGVVGATSGVGVALGSVNGALNLDVVLTQLERMGRGRILSTPRVTTQNNIEAEMTQGVQIPIQTVANNTVTVTFQDAALSLKVLPQITAANTIIMRINLENASPDFSRSINNIPPIDTQRAVTTVLVADGETTVIGGIYVSREQSTQGRVPLLHRIPLLGWLFKRDEVSDESRELLIFITPRITRS